jgi:hypothetical protein
MTSDFDKLKDEAEKEVQEHPEQVKEGEQAAEKEGKAFLDKQFGGEQQDSGSAQQGQDQASQG